MMATGVTLRCIACAATCAPSSDVWRCACGGAFAFEGPVELPESAARLSMGEGGTPLVALELDAAPRVMAKLEYFAPTLSFKDRGAVLVVAAAVDGGARELVADSSGNAGVSVAAYAARAGLPCHVFVPAHVTPSKRAALDAHRALVHSVDGDRSAVTDATLDFLAADPRRSYASHVWSPWFTEGTKRFVLEAREQLGALPDAVVVPAGNGTLVLGAERAIRELGDVVPIVAVQAASCSPLADAFEGAADGAPREAGWAGPAAPVSEPLAEGIAVPSPPRAADVLAAVTATGGCVVRVDDNQVRAAVDALAAQGLWVEPTAAVAVAAVLAGHPASCSSVLVPLTGAGRRGMR